MAIEKIQVPDLGDAEEVEVIEVLVNPGDSISENDSMVVLETDKAAMEIPAPKGGTVKELLVKVGDKVSQGSDLLTLEAEGGSDAPAEEKSAAPEPEEEAPEKAAEESKVEEKPAEPETKPEPAKAGSTSTMEVAVPDIGDADEVEVIEILVAEGDEIDVESGLITLETDKAAMDVPSPAAGKVKAIRVKVGDKVSEGTLIIDLETSGGDDADTPAPAPEEKKAEKPAAKASEHVVTAEEAEAADSATTTVPEPPQEVQASSGGDVYAGPAVRKLARELGVDLTQVKGTGTKNRIQKEDVHAFVKGRLQQKPAAGTAASGAGIPGIPAVDFSKFGPVEEVEMTKLHQVTAQNMSRNWLNVPHVTQFDKADVTDLEDFRAAQKALAEKKGVKLTPVPFIIKACAKALQEYPQFNVSLDSTGTKLIKKQYVHIGVAVATPAGLMVPVLRDVDKKSIWEIAAEVVELGQKAKDRRLTREQMEGACFTISSLGALGGNGFTPIVNAPEVAILGVSNTSIEPVWKDGEFVPRKMMPFSLSYDHRAVNGVDGGQFCTYLRDVLSDIRLLAL